MGYHFLNLGLIGDIYGVADAQRQEPPILAYGIGEDVDLSPVAAEYLAWDPSPDLFHGEDDDGYWEPWAPDSDFSALHAWVDHRNPDGVCHATNPREQVHPEGCLGGH